MTLYVAPPPPPPPPPKVEPPRPVIREVARDVRPTPPVTPAARPPEGRSSFAAPRGSSVALTPQERPPEPPPFTGTASGQAQLTPPQDQGLLGDVAALGAEAIRGVEGATQWLNGVAQEPGAAPPPGNSPLDDALATPADAGPLDVLGAAVSNSGELMGEFFSAAGQAGTRLVDQGIDAAVGGVQGAENFVHGQIDNLSQTGFGQSMLGQATTGTLHGLTSYVSGHSQVSLGVIKGAATGVTGAVALGGGAMQLTDPAARANFQQSASAIAQNPGQALGGVVDSVRQNFQENGFVATGELFSAAIPGAGVARGVGALGRFGRVFGGGAPEAPGLPPRGAVGPNGPSPQLTRADPAALDTAQDALAAGRPLTPEQTAAVLQDTAHAGRARLVPPGQTPEQALSPDGVQGLCGAGQALSHQRLTELGVNPNDISLHQAANAFPGSPFRHSFVTARLNDGNTYMVDPTFRQFVRPDAPLGAPGRALYETPEGTALANELLTNGYARLDDARANLLGQAFSPDSSRRYTVEDLQRPTAQDLDYDPEELEEFFPADRRNP